LYHQHQLLAQWGEPHKADLTFSVAKTYLALLAGLAFDQGLIPNVHTPVAEQCPGIGFEGERLSRITWHHLLQQTSEWEGTCLGIPEQVDRYRWLAYQTGQADGQKGDARPLGEPGSRFEYNDVRINQLSLALLHVFERPLPEVFEEFFRKPLGCSDDFQWVGYEQGWTEVKGQRMMSVPGGSHWGGGVSISAMDQARIGLMLMGQGQSMARDDAAALRHRALLRLPDLVEQRRGAVQRCAPKLLVCHWRGFFHHLGRPRAGVGVHHAVDRR
jgi:CubicO group peptidase (beta-lactamase class C family)